MLKESKGFLSLVVFSGVFLLFAGFCFPSLFAEDGIVEMASAIMFAMVSAISAYCYVAARGRGALTEQAATVFLVPVSLILALSEVSFGARIGLLAPPAMYGGGEFDGGHDLLILGLRLVRDGHVPIWAFIALAVLIPAAGWAFWHWRRLASHMAYGIISNPFLLLIATSVAFLALAIVLDLKSSRHLSLIEETLEFLSAMILLLAVGTRAMSLKRADLSDAKVFEAYAMRPKARR